MEPSGFATFVGQRYLFGVSPFVINCFCVGATLVVFGRGIMFELVLFGWQVFRCGYFGFTIAGCVFGVGGVFRRFARFKHVLVAYARVLYCAIFGYLHLSSVCCVFTFVLRGVCPQLWKWVVDLLFGLYWLRRVATFGCCFVLFFTLLRRGCFVWLGRCWGKIVCVGEV